MGQAVTSKLFELMTFYKNKFLMPFAACLSVAAVLVISPGCSQSNPGKDINSRPEAILEEVNTSYPTNLTELESAPFFRKKLPTPPAGQKLILTRSGRAEFVSE
jgi:hypothetical protein